MEIVVFGTFDRHAHPRVQVLVEGLSSVGWHLTYLNEPVSITTADRVAAVQRPTRLVRLALRVARAWVRLARRSRSCRRPDVVLVGYLGVIDVLLARLCFPRSTIVLDHLAPVGRTVEDRAVGAPIVKRGLSLLDALAERAAHILLVDTEATRDTLHTRSQDKTLVVPVGAPRAWFGEPRPASEPMRVVFFGLFTPLQGCPTIGAALSDLARRGVVVEATLIGSGQDEQRTRETAADAPVRWISWVPPNQLPALVAEHDVCLGIFGTTAKARRVVPNKVYQGAAAGCAIVTSDTAPQRAILHDAAIYVRPGSSSELAEALATLAAEPGTRERRRQHAHQAALERFQPQQVVAELDAALRSRLSAEASRSQRSDG